MPQFTGTSGSDILIGDVTNDTIEGLAGSDILVGDLEDPGVGHPDLILECEAGVGQIFGTAAGLSNQSHASHNDVIDDGSGGDIVVGEAYAFEYGDLQLNALAGAGALFGGPGGNSNAVRCFNDLFLSGSGGDQFVGDVYHVDGQDEAELNAAAGSSGLGHFSFFPHGPGGNGGNSNSVEAFNDRMSDERSNTGDDLLVGDVFGNGGATQILNALAGAGGRTGGSGGHANLVRAFNDFLIGDTGSDLMVGDVYGVSGNDDMVFHARAGTGGDDPGGGSGGHANIAHAFSDTLFGGSGGDLLIGDAFQVAAPQEEIRFVIGSGAPGAFGGGPGGAGNAVAAFNDQLFGQGGDDWLIGDARRVSGTEDIRVIVEGAAGNLVTAFQDGLSGGPGDDRLIGDFFGDVASDPPLIELSGAFGNRARLFGDTLEGDAGADTLTGGLGADRMVGGTGKDVFVYVPGDLFDLVGGTALGAPPVDGIIDFVRGADKVDLSALLADLGFDRNNDPVSDWLSYAVLGANGQISIDLDGPAGGFGFQPMLVIVGLTGGISATSLVNAGDIVV